MTTHKVKSWTFLFEESLKGNKTHDVRIMDRDYKVGDTLIHQEYDWGAKEYTGREAEFEITYITSKDFIHCAFSPSVLHPDFGVLSIRKKG